MEVKTINTENELESENEVAVRKRCLICDKFLRIGLPTQNMDVKDLLMEKRLKNIRLVMTPGSSILTSAISVAIHGLIC